MGAPCPAPASTIWRTSSCATSAALSLVLLLVLVAGCGRTPPFEAEGGGVLPGSVARFETVRLGGLEQRLLIRGRSAAAPPLILLHGGPGASETAPFRAFVPGLEDRFLVVYWDQRGAGRSFDPDTPRETMTIERFVADLDALVDHVRSGFGSGPVYLLAHSWGTVFGLIYAHRHPEKVAAYVGVAQAADYPRAEALAWRWARERARERGNAEAVSDLAAIGPPPHGVDAMLTSRRWVDRFGGSFHGGMGMGDLILAALRTPEATPWDLYLFGRGNRFSLEALWPEIRETSLTSLKRFKVPVFFLLGRYDMQVPAEVAAAYHETVSAPCKRLFWFEDSAHTPPFEQPDLFIDVVAHRIPALVASEECEGRVRMPAGNGG